MISHKFSGLLGLIFLLHSQWTLAQNTQKVTVFKIDQPIVLDGLIDEDVWKKAESARNAATMKLILILNRLISDEKLPVPGASVR